MDRLTFDIFNRFIYWGYDMSLWAKLFGSDKVVEKTLEITDEAFYTDQEEASDRLARFDKKAKVLEAYEPFKLAQRYLAMIVLPPYALAWFVTFCASFFVDTSKQIDMLTSSTGIPAIALAISIFYFGGGVVNSIRK